MYRHRIIELAFVALASTVMIYFLDVEPVRAIAFSLIWVLIVKLWEIEERLLAIHRQIHK